MREAHGGRGLRIVDGCSSDWGTHLTGEGGERASGPIGQRGPRSPEQAPAGSRPAADRVIFSAGEAMHWESRNRPPSSSSV